MSAEILACRQVSIYAENNNISKIAILTDSLSGLQAINNSKHGNYLLDEFIKKVNNNMDIVEIHYVPGHSNIHFNEIADAAAKDASINGDNLNMAWPIKDANNAMANILWSEWKLDYEAQAQIDHQYFALKCTSCQEMHMYLDGLIKHIQTKHGACKGDGVNEDADPHPPIIETSAVIIKEEKGELDDCNDVGEVILPTNDPLLTNDNSNQDDDNDDFGSIKIKMEHNDTDVYMEAEDSSFIETETSDTGDFNSTNNKQLAEFTDEITKSTNNQLKVQTDFMTALTKSINEQLTSHKTLITKLTQEIGILRHDIRQLKTETSLDFEGNFKLSRKLPFNTVIDLKNFDQELQINTELVSELKQIFLRIGGKDFTSFTKSMIKKMMTDPLAVDVTWRGTKEKPSIRQMFFVSIITEMVHQKFSNVEDVRIHSILQQHILHARDRVHKRVKSVQENTTNSL
ncbi:uncharacterized protein isoform X2 [Musca autumnalis]